MKLSVEVLNKEIERRTILMKVEKNVLIQNDMHIELLELKYAVAKLKDK